MAPNEIYANTGVWHIYDNLDKVVRNDNESWQPTTDGASGAASGDHPVTLHTPETLSIFRRFEAVLAILQAVLFGSKPTICCGKFSNRNCSLSNQQKSSSFIAGLTKNSRCWKIRHSELGKTEALSLLGFVCVISIPFCSGHFNCAPPAKRPVIRLVLVVTGMSAVLSSLLVMAFILENKSSKGIRVISRPKLIMIWWCIAVLVVLNFLASALMIKNHGNRTGYKAGTLFIMTAFVFYCIHVSYLFTQISIKDVLFYGWCSKRIKKRDLASIGIIKSLQNKIAGRGAPSSNDDYVIKTRVERRHPANSTVIVNNAAVDGAAGDAIYANVQNS